MSLADHERLEVLQAFQETFGDRAGIVYEMMRPAENLVTKEDLASAVAGLATKDELASAVAVLATKDELASAVAGLATKDELAELRTELTTEMAGLRIEMAGLSATVERRISEGFQQQTRSLMFMIMGSVLLVILTNALQSALG